MEVAQKRLALQQERLEIDKQMLLAEKKRFKQEKIRQKNHDAQCHARIQELQAQLAEATSVASAKQLQEAQHEVEELQMQLHKQQDAHDATVGELELKVTQLQDELQHTKALSSSAAVNSTNSNEANPVLSPSKQSSNNYAIQQYKNKLQSLRLAMEVAVRRTETEWKEKVDELEVQMATQEGEFEDELEKKTQEVLVQVNDLQQELDFANKTHAEERMLLQATIEQLRSAGQPPAATNTAVTGMTADAASKDDELHMAKEELASLQRRQNQYEEKQHMIVTELRSLIAQINSTEPDRFTQAAPLIQEKATSLERELNALELKGGASKNADATSQQPSRPVVRLLSKRKSSRINEKRLRHVTDLDWDGSSSGHQRGKYSGYVNEETGEPHGRGMLKFYNGDLYEGEFKHGRRHGQGVYTWSQGDLYTGPWCKNRRHGHGVFVWSDGRLYDGDYNMGKREGKGTFTWPYGAKYEGEFKGNKRCGSGVYVHPDGKTYTGEYLDDKMHGQGVLTDPKGLVLSQGRWVHGQCVGEE